MSIQSTRSLIPAGQAAIDAAAGRKGSPSGLLDVPSGQRTVMVMTGKVRTHSGISLRTVMLWALLAFLSLAWAAPAQAHSAVDITYPADGAVLESAPKEIAIGFNELVTMPPGSAALIDSTGESIPLPTPAVTQDGEGSNARMSPVPEIEDGWYAVRWAAVSADGHPVRGTFTFYVGDPTAAATADTVATEEIEDPVALYRALGPYLRGLTYLAVLLAIGALAGVWAVSSPRNPMPASTISRARRVAAISAGVGLVLAPLTLINTAIGLNGGISETLGSTFQLVLQSSSGASLLVRMSAMFAVCTAVLLLMERFTRKAGYVIGFLAAVGSAYSFAMSGHAAVLDEQLIASIAVSAHLVAASFWLGAIPTITLAAWTRKDTEPAAFIELFDRYSKLATVSVLLVLIAGGVLSWQMFETPDELFATEYGIALLIKIAIVSLIALIGAFNHFYAVPALRRDMAAGAGDHALTRLRATVLAETVGLIAVLVATAVLTLFGAPKAEGNHVEHQGFGHGSAPLSDIAIQEALTSLEPKIVTGPVSLGELEINYLPGQAGRENRFTVSVYDKNGKVTPLNSVKVDFTFPAQDLGPIERRPVEEQDGSWMLLTRDLGVAGTWQIRVEVEAADGSIDFLEADIEITNPDTAIGPE